MIADKLGYRQVGAATLAVKAGPAGLFSITCVVAGNITVYDHPSAASGNVLFLIVGATAGQIFNWGGTGMSANQGLTAVSTGTFNICYT